MIEGIHHVTAICGDAQTNVDFYAGVLGMRLVKKTVNFDDPGTYHLYYGDAAGSPGTILTFFPWPGAARGRAGAGQVLETVLEVPTGSIADYWRRRLADAGVAAETREGRLVLSDPDGMVLSLVEVEPSGEGGGSGTVPPEFTVRRIQGVRLGSLRPDATDRFLADVVEIGAPTAMRAASEELPRGTLGAGAVHHVAFRLADDAAQTEWIARLKKLSASVSPVMDRQYFHSIYFREPGGVLFELATDPPGFATDEPLETLGTRLCLPEWLEPKREEIESLLPKLRAPGG